jgi:hypothetical protein
MTRNNPSWAEPDLNINGYTLKQTSIACPEQYDVLDSHGNQAGYLRLRHGSFRADYPDCGGETVYESSTKGDGCFEDYERIPELTKAITALDEAHRKANR